MTMVCVSRIICVSQIMIVMAVLFVCRWLDPGSSWQA